MMKKFLWIFSLAGLLLACNNNDDPEPKPENENAITVLAYLVANNDIEDALKDNIVTMFKGLYNVEYETSLLIYWDGKSQLSEINTPVVLKYTTDGKGRINGNTITNVAPTLEEVVNLAEIVKEYPSQISTNKQVMTKVLNDMVELVKTNKIGLIAGSHASSWVPATSTRAFGDDGGTSIQIADMAEAISSTSKIFDFLLFDACLMGSAEVCYDFRNMTNYQIVSVLEIPAYGFPYDRMLSNLYEGNKEGYIKACQTYIDFYNEKSINTSSWGTISLIDSKNLDNLAKLINQEISSHKNLLKDFDYTKLQEYGRRTFKYCSFDMKQFIKVLNNDVIPTYFEEQFNKTVIYTDYVKDAYYQFIIDHVNYSGFGLYIPIKRKYEWNNYFKGIEWYTAAGWNEVDFSWNF